MLIGIQLHLKGERQVILNIRIVEILDISVCPRPAQAVEEHDFRRLLSIHFRHQVGRFGNSVSM